jgi:ribonuclease Z
MKFFKIIVMLFSLGLVINSSNAIAKPDYVDGVSVPSGRIPQEIMNNRYPRTYYPNTEKLGKDEMRITALGTGMPNQSPSNVAA